MAQIMVRKWERNYSVGASAVTADVDGNQVEIRWTDHTGAAPALVWLTRDEVQDMLRALSIVGIVLL